MHTIKQPVTLGSRVPLCPVFSTRSMRLSQATTSCEEGLDGLSKLMTPDLCDCALSDTMQNRIMKQYALDIRDDVSFQWTATGRYGCEVAGPDQELVIIF